MRLNSPLIGITMGDPAGIGPEVVIKSFASNEGLQMDCYPFVLGDGELLRKTHQDLNIDLEIRPFQKLEDLSQETFKDRTMNVLDFDNVDLEELVKGEVQSSCGKSSFEYIEKACEFCLGGEIQAMVTGPINKQSLKAAGHPYPGHTEILADLCGVSTEDVTMMLVSGNLRIFHVTLHQSLRSAVESIDKEGVVKTIELAERVLGEMSIASPEIGVAALNPHASDGGRFGNEEDKIIEPAIEKARSSGIDAKGPIPADTLFTRAKEGEFDGEVALYHDQGHIPIKMSGFMEGVNVTVGIPIIRTSVDHGTAFDIAGKGKADPRSMIRAVKIAKQMIYTDDR